MKVLVAHSEYRVQGGEEQAMRNDVAALRARGHDVEVVLVSSDELPSAPVGPLMAAARTVWSRTGFRRVRDAIAAMGPDVIHVHNTFPNLGHAAWVAARERGVPVVQTLHNFRWFCCAGVLARAGGPCTECLDARSAAPALRHRCYRTSVLATATVAAYGARARRKAIGEGLVQRLLVPSEFMRSVMVEQGVPPGRLFVRPNVSPPLQAGELPVHDLRPGFVLFVGRLSAEKGVDVLFDAWTGHAEAPDGAGLPQLVVAGSGDPDIESRLRSRAEAHPEAIRMVGRVEREALAALLDATDLVVVPSTCHENQPMVVIEAFSRGTPVVVSDVGGLPELVRGLGPGLGFAPGDPADLRRVVTEFLARPATARRQLGREARRIWTTRFAPESNIEQLISHYEAVGALSDRAGAASSGGAS
jgi:glycosyltransferase involved in cell wall biosynthesis